MAGYRRTDRAGDVIDCGLAGEEWFTAVQNYDHKGKIVFAGVLRDAGGGMFDRLGRHYRWPAPPTLIRVSVHVALVAREVAPTVHFHQHLPDGGRRIGALAVAHPRRGEGELLNAVTASSGCSLIARSRRIALARTDRSKVNSSFVGSS